MVQTTQNLPETDPTIKIPYLEEVEITKETFGRNQRKKNIELDAYLEENSKNFQNIKYDMVNSEKRHRQNSNPFVTANSAITSNRNSNLFTIFAVLFLYIFKNFLP